MKIMGLDLSTSCTGVSLPDRTTMALKPPARLEGDDRLFYLTDHVGLAARTCRAELVVVEDVRGVYKGAAARVIPMLHGMVRRELKQSGITYMPLNQTTLKRFATGSAGADKTAMALAALKRLGREYATDDECDADWLRVAGRTAYGWGEPTGEGSTDWLRMPKDHVEALHHGVKGVRLVWPTVGIYEPWPGLNVR